MLHLILVEAALEIVPEVILRHPSVRRNARRKGKKAKQTILDWASKMLLVPADQLEAGDGRIYLKDKPAEGLSFKEVLQYAQSQNWGTAVGTASLRAPAAPPHFVVVFVEVDVDTMTGEVKVVRVVQGADVGTPIIPSAVRGQLIGQGFGQGG